MVLSRHPWYLWKPCKGLVHLEAIWGFPARKMGVASSLRNGWWKRDIVMEPPQSSWKITISMALNMLICSNLFGVGATPIFRAGTPQSSFSRRKRRCISCQVAATESRSFQSSSAGCRCSATKTASASEHHGAEIMGVTLISQKLWLFIAM